MTNNNTKRLTQQQLKEPHQESIGMMSHFYQPLSIDKAFDLLAESQPRTPPEQSLRAATYPQSH